MNKKVLRTLLVCCIIPPVIGLMFFMSDPRKSEFFPMMGLSFLTGFIILILPAILLTIIQSSREYGKGMLLACGVMLLVGFSLCSIQPLNFH